jgi:hypothetical protein
MTLVRIVIRDHDRQFAEQTEGRICRQNGEIDGQHRYINRMENHLLKRNVDIQLGLGVITMKHV